jgi:CheY-like chemotaxis protein
LKVLIIDDEDDIRSIAAMSLGLLGGAEVVEADSGRDGIAKAMHERFDVILLDMMMPGMDGPSTLTALRENPTTNGIPVIFLTARAMNSEVEQLKKMGAKGILTKPFDPASLLTQVRSILEAS